MDGQAVEYNGNVLLTMAPDTVGTLLASSTYMWYGNVKAKFKTSRGKGVVTAFILLSDVKDEIDYEFVGSALEDAQTNYYFQGITNYNNGGNISLSDTFNNYHTYEIDWTPDEITWKIDGQVGRTKKRSETWNATDNQWHYPQTPSRVQLSLWPGGLESNAKGTVDWAGGYVDWESEDIKNNGYYYAAFDSVEINCYDAKSAPGTNNGVSYTYNDERGTNDTVVDGNKPTVLKSLQGTGTDMNAGDPSKQESSSKSGSSSKPTETAETIPGLSGAGPGSDNHADGESNSGGSSGSGSSGGSSSTDSSQGAESTSGSSDGAFNQGGGASNSNSNDQNSADKLGSPERILKGSVFAGIIAVVAMMAL
jgi:beta-glucanase (GH16 family)